jgi:large subunit ribosomal protein L35
MFLKEKKMPKMKTKSGAKKRFKTTATGKVKCKQAYARHMMMNKPKSMKRKAKGMGILSDADARTVLRSWLPYAGKRKKKPTAKKAEGGA